MLFDQLKADKVTAMKESDKEKSDTLGVVIAKAMLALVEKRAKGEELTDADVIAVLQKAEKELTDEREGYVKLGREENVKSMDRQIAIVKAYIPAMMSEEEKAQMTKEVLEDGNTYYVSITQPEIKTLESIQDEGVMMTDDIFFCEEQGQAVHALLFQRKKCYI